LRVVELNEVELVSVGVRGCAKVAVGDGGICASLFGVSIRILFGTLEWDYSPMQIELEPPASRVLGSSVVPVVYEVAR
jgi:hypothetical protein